ncbi:hypothetical protein ONZ45_g13976 [Pleurotus djamor]|nr:hypothetical protein ONZ45_g13976 [Pleurotus djamor]
MKLPISLYWHTRERRADAEMSTIMTLGGHIEDLSIFTRTGLNTYSQHEIFPSLQHLKKLSIRSSMVLYASSLDLTQVPSPQLSTLRLSGVEFFPTPEMHGLRHLMLTDKPWSTTQLLGLLGSLPNVETFMLSELVGPGFIPSSKASMTLPGLRELTLECKDFKKTNLFDLFKYPPSCHFSLRCTRGQVDIDGLVALELPLSHFASSASPFTNIRAVLKIESWRHQSSCQLALYEGSVPSPVFNLDLPVMERDPSFMDHYIRLLSKLPLKVIPRLAIKCKTSSRTGSPITSNTSFRSSATQGTSLWLAKQLFTASSTAHYHLVGFRR